MPAGQSGRRSFAQWCLGGERPADLAQVVALFAVYLVLDRLTRSAARLSGDAVQHSVLVARAAVEHPASWIAIAVACIGALVGAPSRFLTGWQALEQGAVLRRMAAVPLLLAAWQLSAYHYNFLAGHWHAVDRLLVVALAAASLWRPLFLVPFVLTARVVAGQFAVPFGTVAGPNIDALLVTVLVGFAALHACHVATGVVRSASMLIFVPSVVASHFFVPGSGKLGLGWLGTDRLWYFPLSAYTAGWLGHTDGDWARLASQLARPFNLPLQLATLGVEFGAVIAMAHYGLVRWWLVLAIAFHVMVFAATGFWFLAWVAVEVTLLLVIWAPGLRAWVAQNATPARGVLAAGLVIVAGSRLYQPPTLSWFDGPVSYGYELEGLGVSGTSYHVPFAVAAPFEQELSFLRLRLSPHREATDAYGAVGSRAELEALTTISSWEDLARYERNLSTPSNADLEASERFLVRLLEHVNADGRPSRLLWPLPTHFWSSRPPPRYAYQEPLARLEAVRVTALHRPDGPIFRRESMVIVGAAAGGSARVIARPSRSSTAG